ncbi:hypothetical protein [Bradyrhizobium genomosp. I (2014)]|uniref:hypothetical protein n=1 Tax=Bradyrhizobium genomosp. I (2014) TaxID=2683269 RepID=UPI00054EF72F|nr:hypothetical protein [Bradyrhizobium sp. CCBAU 43298]
MAKTNTKTRTQGAAARSRLAPPTRGPTVVRLLPPASIVDEDPPLPPYMRAHENRRTGSVHFRCDVSTRMRKAGFPLPNLSLGTDLHQALSNYDAQFAPVLKEWKENAAAVALDLKPVVGSLEWAYVEYQTTDRYDALADETKLSYGKSIRRCCNYVPQTGRFAGRRFGTVPVRWMTEADVDNFYSEYVRITGVDDKGKETVRKRSATARNDIQTVRTMLNALKRKHPNLVMHNKANSFAGVYMPHRTVSPPPVKLEWLAPFVRTADRKGLKSVSAIVLYCWELEVRVTHYPYKFTCDQFRGPNHEDQIFVDAEKVGEQGWFELWDDDGHEMYHALRERLTELKGNRFGDEPLFLSERADRTRPWRPAELRAAIKEICEEAGLPPLNLSQFRKGGMEEAHLAGLTPAEFTATSLHANYGTVAKHYTQKHNPELAMNGQHKRINLRGRKRKRGIDIVT